MERTHDVDKIDLKITEFEPFVNKNHRGFIINWEATIGFGEYIIYQKMDSDDKTWYADTETMDSNEDKAFGRKLLELFMDMVNVEVG